MEQQSPPRPATTFSTPSATGAAGKTTTTDFSLAATAKVSSSNRMPGNIVCGICGAVRYYSFILQAKKFGTFSCEPCRKFISRMIRQLRGVPDELQIDCVSGNGKKKDRRRTAANFDGVGGNCFLVEQILHLLVVLQLSL